MQQRDLLRARGDAVELGVVDRLGRTLSQDERIESLLEGAWLPTDAAVGNTSSDANGILVLTNRRLHFVRVGKSRERVRSIDRPRMGDVRVARTSWFPVLEVDTDSEAWRVAVFSGGTAAEQMSRRLRLPVGPPHGSGGTSDASRDRDVVEHHRSGDGADDPSGSSAADRPGDPVASAGENLEERTRELLDHVDRLFTRGRDWAREHLEPAIPRPGSESDRGRTPEMLFQEAKQAYQVYAGLADLGAVGVGSAGRGVAGPGTESTLSDAYRNDLFALAALTALAGGRFSEAEMSFLVMLLLPIDSKDDAAAFFSHASFPSEWSDRLLRRWDDVLEALQRTRVDLPETSFRLIRLATEQDAARGSLYADRVRSLYDRIAEMFAKADGAIGPEEAERL